MYLPLNRDPFCFSGQKVTDQVARKSFTNLFLDDKIYGESDRFSILKIFIQPFYMKDLG